MKSASICLSSLKDETSASHAGPADLALGFALDFFHSRTGSPPKMRGLFFPTPRTTSAPEPFGCIEASIRTERLSAIRSKSALMTMSVFRSRARIRAASSNAAANETPFVAGISTAADTDAARTAIDSEMVMTPCRDATNAAMHEPMKNLLE